MAAAIDPTALAGLGTVAEPRWAPDGRSLAWIRATPLGWVLVVDGTPVPDLVPAGIRGGTCTWLDGERLLVVGEGGVRSVRADGAGPGALVAPASGRAAAPAVSAADGLVAFVDETDDTCRVMVAPLDASRDPWPVSTADFAWDPAWSPDGRLLAWHEWDDPAMPWDGSRIVVGDLDAGERTVVAGGDAESVGQPRFAPAGPPRLAVVRDRDGWTNLTVVGPDGRDVTTFADAREHAEPSWGPGQRSFAWSPDGARLAWCRNEDGFGRLVAAAVDGGPVAEWSKGWHHGLDWGPAGLACVRSGARTPPTVVVVAATGVTSEPERSDPPARRTIEVAAGADALGIDAFVEPTPVSWIADDGVEVPGLWFAPATGARGAEAGPPPLLVHLHGGPTDQTRVEWAPRLQYWIARGWAVLAPNPRGSTGSGRAYATALHGGWGDRDVDDVVAGIRAIGDRGWADPQRVAVVGGSAGGFVALLVALRAPELVGAVVASYPVTDLRALAADTHRFERHYNDSLVGDDVARLVARAPLTHASELRVPVLVLQGDADPVVPVAHSVAFVDAVRAAGGDATLQVYPGEGHGWRSSTTVADALTRTEAFLGEKVLNP